MAVSTNSQSSDSDGSCRHDDLERNGSGLRKRRKLSHDEIEKENAPRTSEDNSGLSRIKRVKPTVVNVKPSELKAQDITSLKAQAPTAKDFSALKVAPWLVESLTTMAIQKPTGIQAGCIPEILRGRDCIGGSRTGSGKTVAFAVPILQKWAEDPVGIYAVVLTPTRELALQIYEQFNAIGTAQSMKAILIIGGADMRAQALALNQRPHVVIATPGRLADHIKNSGEDTVCGLRRARFVVLDEADRLLASGPGSMLDDVGTCMSALPPSTERQTCLFTATVTPEVRALKESKRLPGQHEVFVCEVDTDVLAIPQTLDQRYLQVPVTQRESYLHILLLTAGNVNKSTIIFCNRTTTATLLEHMLRLLDHRVTSLHSGIPQPQRIANLGRFRAKAARILVATDVAARGLDIPEVALVINYDVPRDPDDYIHRVGRTARAGRHGQSITMIGQRDVELVLAIETRVGKPMEAFEEEGVNIETRVIREGLKRVGEKKREALLQIEEGRGVTGKRKTGPLRKSK